ncbi:MAG TPA: SRPBCC domain-containing protein [Bacteroidota bacterium]
MNVTLNASPSEVFDALTNAKSILEWSGQRGKVEPTIGGKFEMFDGWVRGKVLAYQKGKTLSYTWLPDDWDAASEPSIVRYSFSPAKSGTKVSLTHSGFPDKNAKLEHEEGWKEHVFEPLKGFFGSQ